MSYHSPVLLTESIDGLSINPDGIYVDGTAGGAGHSLEIAKRLKNGKLYALDRDPTAVAIASDRLKGYPAQVIQSNFKDMCNVLDTVNVPLVDGILLDLGVSSYQLDTAERGFSYHKESRLDMRMSQSGLSAEDVVNDFTATELADIFWRFGEEKFSRKIASQIVKVRNSEKITSTLQLADIIANAVPASARRNGHPARKCFQAIIQMIFSSMA